MGFIFGVLVIGALLAAIFGRGVAQLFVIGTATIISWIVIGISLFIISGLVYAQFHPQPAYTPTSLGDPTVNTYVPPGHALADSPAPSAPTYQAPTASSAGASSPLTVAPTPSSPTMGIATQPADPRLSAQFSMRPGFGATVVSVTPGGPAEQAGLVPGDFVQAMDADPITANHTLSDYEVAKGAGQTIRLSVQHNNGGQWVHEWVKVIPR